MRWPIWLGLALAVLGLAPLANHALDAPSGAQVGGTSPTLTLFGVLLLAGMVLLGWGLWRSEGGRGD